MSKKYKFSSGGGSRKVGTHKGCGGEVFYGWYGTSISWLACKKCGQTSMKGAAPEVEKV